MGLLRGEVDPLELCLASLCSAPCMHAGSRATSQPCNRKQLTELAPALVQTLMLAGHQAMRPGQALDYGRKMGLHQFSGNSAAT